MAVYKTIPLQQATDRQAFTLSANEKSAGEAIVSQFITLFKEKHL